MNVALSEKNITADIIAAQGNASTPTPDAALRQEAWQAFQAQGLPAGKAEEYKYTPITRALEKNFQFTSLAPMEAQPVDASLYLLPGLDAHVLVFINGRLSAKDSRFDISGVDIRPLSEALSKDPATVLQHLGRHAGIETDPFVAWNTAAWTEGVYMHIPGNTVVEKPVVLYHVHDARASQAISATRHLIVVGKNARVTVLEKFGSTGEHPHFSNNVIEAVVGENAGFDFYSIQNDAGQRYQAGLVQVHQADHSRVTTFTFTLDGKVVRNNLHLVLDGEGIETHMYGLYLLNNDTLADNHTVADHKKPHSFSNELYKGVMDGSSRGVFNGKIYVRPQAQKTNAFQANRNILLTDRAIMNTKPQLEIWADDVKCSHGCTSGQLDEEALFYLQTRGIGKETAQAMVLYAFAAEVLETVKHDGIKAYLDTIISERLHKNF